MSDKCTHATSIVIFGADGLSILVCTWECQKHLISVEMPNGITATWTVDELAQLQDENVTLNADITLREQATRTALDECAAKDEALILAREYCGHLPIADARYFPRLAKLQTALAALSKVPA